MKRFKLAGYYKYQFRFISEDGTTAVYGPSEGDASDIYRVDIIANKLYTLEELKEMFGEVEVLEN